MFALNKSANLDGPGSSTARQEQSCPGDHAVRSKADSAEPEKPATAGQPSAGHAAVVGQGKQTGSDNNAVATAGPSQQHDADLTSEMTERDALEDGGNIWSVAYRDAIQKLDEDKREMVLRNQNLDQLLKDLGERDAESAENSLFRKGLKKVQKSLENVKLAVDIAQPFIGLEPVAATATGAVKSFTIVGVLSIPPVHIRYRRLTGDNFLPPKKGCR